MQIGGYTLDLYCDNTRNHRRLRYRGEALQFPLEYAGPNERDCVRQATAAGWQLSRTRGDLCPLCNPESRWYEAPSTEEGA